MFHKQKRRTTQRHRLARLLFLKMRLLPALRPFAPHHTSVWFRRRKNTNRAKFIILRCKAVFEERIFLKTKKTRITHTGVFGCGFDAVFGEIILQKQKYPYKPVPKVIRLKLQLLDTLLSKRYNKKPQVLANLR